MKEELDKKKKLSYRRVLSDGAKTYGSGILSSHGDVFAVAVLHLGWMKYLYIYIYLFSCYAMYCLKACHAAD